MSKTLAALMAGLFAASVFAADAPKADVKPAPAAVPAAAPAAAGAAKTAHKHHKHHKQKKTEAAAPAK